MFFKSFKDLRGTEDKKKANTTNISAWRGVTEALGKSQTAKKAVKILKNDVFQLVLVIVVVIVGTIQLIKAYVPDRTAPVANTEKTEMNIGSLRVGITDFALSLTGKKYRHGAKGPNYFDCSGFTGYVFRQFEVKLPASALSQSKFGEKVGSEEVQKGDLLFFKATSSRENPDVGHVGIVTSNEAGKVEFVHSSVHKGVTVDSLSHKYYAARFVLARRVLQ